jgi:hypothetical protein
LSLITPSTCGLSWLRLSSCVLSCINGDVLLLGTNDVGDVVGDVACSISGGIGHNVSGRVGCCVGGSVTTPSEIIPYYRLNHSSWSLSDNKEPSR